MTISSIVDMIKRALLVREGMTITNEIAGERAKNIAQMLYPYFDPFYGEDQTDKGFVDNLFDPRD